MRTSTTPRSGVDHWDIAPLHAVNDLACDRLVGDADNGLSSEVQVRGVGQPQDVGAVAALIGVPDQSFGLRLHDLVHQTLAVGHHRVLGDRDQPRRRFRCQYVCQHRSDTGTGRRWPAGVALSGTLTAAMAHDTLLLGAAVCLVVGIPASTFPGRGAAQPACPAGAYLYRT